MNAGRSVGATELGGDRLVIELCDSKYIRHYFGSGRQREAVRKTIRTETGQALTVNKDIAQQRICAQRAVIMNRVGR